MLIYEDSYNWFHMQTIFYNLYLLLYLLFIIIIFKITIYKIMHAPTYIIVQSYYNYFSDSNIHSISLIIICVSEAY